MNKFVYHCETQGFTERDYKDIFKCFFMMRKHLELIRDKYYSGNDISIRINQHGSGIEYTEWDVSGVIFNNKNEVCDKQETFPFEDMTEDDLGDKIRIFWQKIKQREKERKIEIEKTKEMLTEFFNKVISFKNNQKKENKEKKEIKVQLNSHNPFSSLEID